MKLNAMEVYDGPPMGRVRFRNPFAWEANNQEDYLRMASGYRKQREEELASILAWEKEKRYWQAIHSAGEQTAE